MAGEIHVHIHRKTRDTDRTKWVHGSAKPHLASRNEAHDANNGVRYFEYEVAVESGNGLKHFKTVATGMADIKSQIKEIYGSDAPFVNMRQLREIKGTKDASPQQHALEAKIAVLEGNLNGYGPGTAPSVKADTAARLKAAKAELAKLNSTEDAAGSPIYKAKFRGEIVYVVKNGSNWWASGSLEEAKAGRGRSISANLIQVAEVSPVGQTKDADESVERYMRGVQRTKAGMQKANAAKNVIAYSNYRKANGMFEEAVKLAKEGNRSSAIRVALEAGELEAYANTRAGYNDSVKDAAPCSCGGHK